MKPNRNQRDGHASRVEVALLCATVVIAFFRLGDYPACAQQASLGPTTWEALVTPYFWAPWTDIGINPSNRRIPSASGTVDFDQLAGHLSWVPFTGQIEFRNGPYGFLADYIH